MERAEPGADAVTVRVALHADLRKYLPKGDTGPRLVRLAGGSTVGELLETLGIPATETVTVGLNGSLARRDAVLHDRDDVTMFSPMEGG